MTHCAGVCITRTGRPLFHPEKERRRFCRPAVGVLLIAIPEGKGNGMSNKPKRINLNQARNMDVDAWRDRQIRKRLAAYLERQEQDFIKAHGGDTDAELIAYVHRKAREFHRLPHPLELPGGEYLKKRLGDWDLLARNLGYKPANGQKGRLARECLKQKIEAEFLQERRAIKEAKQRRSLERGHADHRAAMTQKPL